MRSESEFNRIEVDPVLSSLISPSARENCFLASYYRSARNVATLLEFNEAKHFQAIAVLARGILEFGIEVKLIDLIPDSVQKMLHYVELEKLRAAKRLIKLQATAPPKGYAIDPTIYQAFVDRNETRIIDGAKGLWPGKRLSSIKHWSELDLSMRAEKVGQPFWAMYESYYAQLSWYTHAGLTGVINVPPETFVHISAMAYRVAAHAFEELLVSIVKEFKLDLPNPRIEQLLQFAKYLPITDGIEQESQLKRALGV